MVREGDGRGREDYEDYQLKPEVFEDIDDVVEKFGLQTVIHLLDIWHGLMKTKHERECIERALRRLEEDEEAHRRRAELYVIE